MRMSLRVALLGTVSFLLSGFPAIPVKASADVPGAPQIEKIEPVFWKDVSSAWGHTDPNYPYNTGPDYPYHIRPSGKLVVGWSAPESDGGSPITQWKVQWKSGAQDYDSVRQMLLPATTRAPSYAPRLNHLGEIYEESQVPGVPVPDYSVEVAGLAAGTRYVFRVVAANAQGGGSPSAEARNTPTPAKR